MVISIYDCRFPQKNTYFLMTSCHTDALAPLKVVQFFWTISWSAIITKTQLSSAKSTRGAKSPRARKRKTQKFEHFAYLASFVCFWVISWIALWFTLVYADKG